MKSDVCILAAGSGSRLGSLGEVANKALLPLAGKAVISHIIDKFPGDSRFVIALGYKADQVRAYLSIAHPRHNFRFVSVDPFAGPGSGPGFSLLSCRPQISGAFYFVSCDTLWDEGLPNLGGDWMAVSSVPLKETSEYCNLQIHEGLVDGIFDKVSIQESEGKCKAFTGLAHIANSELFWSALASSNQIAGEHQVSNGFRALVGAGACQAIDIAWEDVGTSEKFQLSVKRRGGFDFSKENEFFYCFNGRVIKFFEDARVTQSRVQRSRKSEGCFARVDSEQGQFYSYPWIEGKTLYAHCNQRIFSNLLQFLSDHLWRPVAVDEAKFSSACEKFYQTKTLERVSKYLQKYPERKSTDEVRIRNVLSRLDWQWLQAGKPVFFHGDLQFDNILFDQASGRFTLLDWRQDFAGSLEFGDLYYDLAKLNGGLTLNYDYIKENRFDFSDDGKSVSYDFATRYQCRAYREILKAWVLNHGLKWRKVELLTALIYLNMSPLHHYPFDRLLFELACDEFGRVL